MSLVGRAGAGCAEEGAQCRGPSRGATKCTSPPGRITGLTGPGPGSCPGTGFGVFVDECPGGCGG